MANKKTQKTQTTEKATEKTPDTPEVTPEEVSETPKGTDGQLGTVTGDTNKPNAATQKGSFVAIEVGNSYRIGVAGDIGLPPLNVRKDQLSELSNFVKGLK